MRLLVVLAIAGLGCVGVAEGGAESGASDVPREPASAPAPVLGPVPQEVVAALHSLYDLGRRTARHDLPGRLDEVSGLAVTEDGRLLAHDDERGRVHVIDGPSGEVGKRWDLGEELVRDDFEGVAIVGDRLFLVSSLGLLYEFREGADRENVAYRRTDTGIGSRCEVEGLEHDPVEATLLLACKASTPDRGRILIHRLPLDPSAPRLDPIRIDKADLPGAGLGDDFAPSGVALSPLGTIVLVSARHEALLEVDRAGRVLAGYQLSRNRHPQPEGIAFGSDGTLYLADEKNGRDARLTLYAPTRPEPETGR